MSVMPDPPTTVLSTHPVAILDTGGTLVDTDDHGGATIAGVEVEQLVSGSLCLTVLVPLTLRLHCSGRPAAKPRDEAPPAFGSSSWSQ
jgi:hypothetical protein